MYSLMSFEHTYYSCICSAEQGQGYHCSITLFSRTDIRLCEKILQLYKEKLVCITSDETQLGNVSRGKINNP